MTPWLRACLIAASCGAILFAQSGVRALTPGKSSKADVERALGAPQRQITDAFVEYSGKPGGEQILVQYRAGSSTVERIDVMYTGATERTAVLESLGHAPTTIADVRSTNAAGRMEEFFKSSRTTLLYRSNQPTGVAKVSRSTPEEFDMAVAMAPPYSGTVAAGVPAAPEVKTAAPPPPAAVAPKPAVPASSPAATSPFASFVGKYAFRRSTEAADQVQIGIVNGAVEVKSARGTYVLRQNATGGTKNADGSEAEQLVQFEVVGQKNIKLTFHVVAGKVTQLVYADFADPKMFTGLAFPVQ